MINKKNLLGKNPHELGDKDAIHVAIVAVRAACNITGGQKCKMNEFNEAVPDAKGIGVADPFRTDDITTGTEFWLLLNQDAVPNVKHVWEHPKVKFDKPTREVTYNQYLTEWANTFGVTFHQLMEACKYVVDNNTPIKYPGSKTEEELEEIMDDMDKYDLWSTWADEAEYEFENCGSACCPEYNYPNCSLFRFEA